MEDEKVRAFCLMYGLEHQSSVLVKYLQDMRWRIAGSRTPQKDCFVAVDIVLLRKLGFTRPDKVMGGVSMSADEVNVIPISTMLSFRGALAPFSINYTCIPAEVERGVIERIVHSPYIPNLCRVRGAALVRCGFILTTCAKVISSVDKPVLRMISTVLDYDVTRVAGPNVKTYGYRRPIIQMFQEGHPGRCVAAADYLRVSSDPRILKVEVHSMSPPTLSLLVDSDMPLTQREIMGDSMPHERCDGFSLSPLADPVTQRDFNPWAFFSDAAFEKLMHTEPMRFLYSMGFNDQRKTNLLMWLVYTSNVVETNKDGECLIMLNKTQTDDLLELLRRDGFVMCAGAMSPEAHSNLAVDKIDAVYAFGAKMTETGLRIANPLTYAPTDDTCYLFTMESLVAYLTATIFGYDDCRLTNEELSSWDDITTLVDHPVSPPDRHMSFRDVMEIMLSYTSGATLMERLSTLKTAVAVHRMSKINYLNNRAEESKVSCTVCLDPAPSSFTTGHNPIALPCGHVFGRSCLIQWQRRANTSKDYYTCPMCRLEYNTRDLLALFI